MFFYHDFEFEITTSKIRLYLAQIYLQNFRFCIEMYADDLDNFVGNGGYHFGEEVKINFLGPRIGVKARRRMVLHYRECTALPPATTITFMMPSS